MRYEKGHKDASRRRIMEVAGERFRCDGIAASGLATIMSDAGLTNGAFYPHFKSKAELVRESVAAAMEDQVELMGSIAEAASRPPSTPICRPSIGTIRRRAAPSRRCCPNSRASRLKRAKFGPNASSPPSISSPPGCRRKLRIRKARRSAFTRR